ncbi:cupredoxin domain-containing protein [Paraburkholderia graminis]|uniref:cupredoxin domain-containing protein n=1 Tax=Paraburkholderia graminis TaxID=60548 RepID=UPI0038BA8937
MATNDFLPFANGGGANVLTQAQYAALTTLLSGGYQSGVANSAQMNKTWRQSSIMAAVLAQFAADYSGSNSTDDGTTATLEANLVAAIRSATKTGVILADTGAANAYTAVNAPPLVAGTWVDGVVQQVRIAHANTGASTYAPDGMTAIPIYGLGLQPLQGGELALNGIAILVRMTITSVNSGNPIAVLMECAGGAQQVAPATQIQHAAQLGQVQSYGGGFGGITPVSSTTSLTNGVSGQLIVLGASAAPTLPDVSTMTIGQSVTFTNQDSAAHTITAFGAQTIVTSGIAVPSLIVQPGQDIVLTARSSSTWTMASGSGKLQFNPVIVAPATQTQHAPQMGQVAGIVGSARNLVMNVTAAAATATLTADEIIVETALGGVRYCLPNFSKTINLATTGAGGMDAGSAPVSGYVALYAIYNPTTGASALLATNTTSAVAPSICNGAVPTGYTASALVSVWQTNASRQFAIGYQVDRTIYIANTTVLASSTAQSTPTSLSIASVIPANARSVSGSLQTVSTASANLALIIYGNTALVGQQGISSSEGAVSPMSIGFRDLPITTSQAMYYTASCNAGTPTFSIAVSSYQF